MTDEKYFQYSVGALRIALGWLFFWAFIDKLFGLGFSTKSEEAWIKNLTGSPETPNSPTFGYLKFGVSEDNFLYGFFSSIAGTWYTDWLFMLALLVIGVTIMFGISVRIGGIIGAILTFLMWLSAFPIEHNPIIDDHVIYMIIFIVFAFKPDVGKWVGLGEYWTKLVGEKYPWLL